MVSSSPISLSIWLNSLAGTSLVTASI
ncbi:UNVERIFIED_CONTAM: hypothetical protein GTU68_051305 [Idotea baltica]|nr:hypothetical protein [Idotea baltica]